MPPSVIRRALLALIERMSTEHWPIGAGQRVHLAWGDRIQFRRLDYTAGYYGAYTSEAGPWLFVHDANTDAVVAKERTDD